jgi:uncharacterized membrane protein YhhN
MTVAVVATVVVALANWWSRWRDDERLEQITKPAATVGAIVVALAAGGPGGPTAAVVAGLVLCLVGDVLLLPAIDRFVVGLAAFLVGHLVFVAAFVQYAGGSWRIAGLALVGCSLLVALYGPPILRGAAARGMSGPVKGHLAVIALMCTVGWSTGNWLACLGATAFVVSDTILGWRRFVTVRPWADVAIMVTYHVAIVSIAASLALL